MMKQLKIYFTLFKTVKEDIEIIKSSRPNRNAINSPEQQYPIEKFQCGISNMTNHDTKNCRQLIHCDYCGKIEHMANMCFQRNRSQDSNMSNRDYRDNKFYDFQQAIRSIERRGKACTKFNAISKCSYCDYGEIKPLFINTDNSYSQNFYYLKCCEHHFVYTQYFVHINCLSEITMKIRWTCPACRIVYNFGHAERNNFHVQAICITGSLLIAIKITRVIVIIF